MAHEDVGFANANASGPQGGSRMSRFGKSICNTEKGEFLGRTCSSWAKIGIFYTIFYACLAGFFAIMLVGFFATLDEKAPTQQRMYSLIKANPGMGFRPMPVVESTLIKFTEGDAASYKPLIDNLKKFFKEYQKPQNTTTVDCGVESRTDLDTVCQATDPSEFGPCTEENDFGYKSGEPCVLLKINRVFDWMPRAFGNASDLNADEKHRFEEAHKRNVTLLDDHITLSCEGEHDADEDNLNVVEFYPKTGFPFRYYPYQNQKDYRSPLVFARFPKIKKGALVQVWCKLWARNIKHHKNDKAGSTHFELFVDKA